MKVLKTMKKTFLAILLTAGCSAELGESVSPSGDLSQRDVAGKDLSLHDTHSPSDGSQADMSAADTPNDLSSHADFMNKDARMDGGKVEPNPVNCPVDQPPILMGAEDKTIIANNTSRPKSYSGKYEDLQGTDAALHPWPNFGDQIRLSLTKNQYISAAFTSGNQRQSGKLVFNPPGFNEGASATNITVSISECPGDFSVHLSQPKCLLVGVPSDTFRWSSDPNSSAATYCKIEKNRDYYLNIVNSRDSENGFVQSSCMTPHCGLLAIQIKSN